MLTSAPIPDRRGFLTIAAAFVGGAMLSGCGGASAAPAADPIAVVPAEAAFPGSPAPAAAAASPLNLALNLTYLGAQFYGFASRGTGLASSSISGAGQQGVASGARQIAFADPMIAGQAAVLAADKAAHVAALRAHLGASAAAQPAIDLSASGPFSAAAQGAGLVSAGAAFDPYADDTSFLIGAFLIENRVAAAYRTLLSSATDADSAALITTNLADAIYHGGVVRALLAGLAATDPTADQATARLSALLASLDGSNVGDQSLAGASGESSNLVDADGQPIAFTRDASQVLRTVYLSAGAPGGFFPVGVNGVAA